MLVFGLAVRALAAGLLEQPTTVVVVPVRLDLNRADVAELALLPGIGPARAAALVLHRVRHGPFARLEELAVVDGFGEATAERLAAEGLAWCGPKTAAGAVEATPR
ncbi:MAG: hypothetical protein RL398_1945 [Planctomycetota bacterium]|jgi:competence ComEA-like helix-hairpin-helix protein